MCKYLLIILGCLLTLNISAQEDSIEFQPKRVLKIEEINLSTIKIFDTNWLAKGFILERDTINRDYSKLNICATIENFEANQFLINYKFSFSKDFIRDTFQIYSNFNHLNIAIPYNKIDNPELIDAYINSPIAYLPASTDERRVAYYSIKNGKIFIYED